MSSLVITLLHMLSAVHDAFRPHEQGLTTSAAPSNDPDGDDARGLGSRSGKSGLAAHEAGGGREGSFPVAAPTTGGSDEALALAFDLWPAYREQFFAAFSVPQPDPDEDEEEDGQPGLSQYIVHLFSIFFKVGWSNRFGVSSVALLILQCLRLL